MSKTDVLERDGQRFVLVPEVEYQRMLDAMEDLADIKSYDQAKREAREFVPATLVDRLIAGDNPIRVWREHRQMSASAVAQAVGVSAPYMSQLEAGKRKASHKVLRKLAEVLALDVDDLI